MPRTIWDPNSDPKLAKIVAVVAVHRLREVACIYGFTRFEPAPLASDDLEDVGLAVKGAPLGQNPDWLPAIEQFGSVFSGRVSRPKIPHASARSYCPQVPRHVRRASGRRYMPRTVGAWHRSPLRFDLARRLDAGA